METKKETLLEIHDLSVSFRMYDQTLEADGFAGDL